MESDAWKIELGKIASTGHVWQAEPFDPTQLILDAARAFAVELRKHGKETQIREKPGNLEISIVGSKGLEIELAISLGDGSGLWVFSKRIVISNFPLEALPIQTQADALKLFLVLYRAARSPGPRV